MTLTLNNRTVKHIAALAAIMLFAVTPSFGQMPELKLTPLPDVGRTSAEPRQQANMPQTSVPAQSPRWIFGLKTSYRQTFAQWSIVNVSEYNVKGNMSSYPGIALGITASYPFRQMWSFDTGADFTTWGFIYTDSRNSMRSMRCTVEIPLTLTFRSNSPFYIQAGAVVDLLLGAITIVDTSGSTIWPSRNAWQTYNPVSLGLTGCIGFGAFSLQFIYNLTNTLSSDTVKAWREYSGLSIAKQSTYALSINYTVWF